MLLYTTIGVATIGGSLALGDRLLDTAYWPNTAGYGQNLFIFVLTCYLLFLIAMTVDGGSGLLLSRLSHGSILAKSQLTTSL